MVGSESHKGKNLSPVSVTGDSGHLNNQVKIFCLDVLNCLQTIRFTGVSSIKVKLVLFLYLSLL